MLEDIVEDNIIVDTVEDTEIDEHLFDDLSEYEEYSTMTIESIDYTEQLTLLNDSIISLNSTVHVFFVVFLLFSLLSRFKIKGDD